MNVAEETTKSVWMDTEVAEAPALDGDQSADVVVVGSGIAGLSTAYELLARGRSVIVLDRGRIGSGMTARTTAHLASALDNRYASLIDANVGHRHSGLLASGQLRVQLGGGCARRQQQQPVHALEITIDSLIGLNGLDPVYRGRLAQINQTGGVNPARIAQQPICTRGIGFARCAFRIRLASIP